MIASKAVFDARVVFRVTIIGQEAVRLAREKASYVCILRLLV